MRKHLQQLASSRRLLILLGISLLLHGMLLISWPTAKPVLEFGYQLQNLSINLEPIEVIGHQQRAQNKTLGKSNTPSIPPPVPKPPAANTQTTLHRKITRQASVADNSMHQHREVTPEVSAPGVNRAYIMSQIRHDLSQYFYYPPYARRKGIQGTVLLSFGISGQGAIQDIRIVKSSGYAILDLAAQDAMQRLEKLSWYAALMHGKNMDLELPVIFRLTEG